jgi:hypothetical protein
MRMTVLLTVLLGFVAALLTSASLLPDPCFAEPDTCCPAQTPDNCGTLCCTGIQAAPEDPVVLVRTSRCESFYQMVIAKPETVTPDLLIRPPIPA